MPAILAHCTDGFSYLIHSINHAEHPFHSVARIIYYRYVYLHPWFHDDP
jgi:hypothetical protein